VLTQLQRLRVSYAAASPRAHLRSAPLAQGAMAVLPLITPQSLSSYHVSCIHCHRCARAHVQGAKREVVPFKGAIDGKALAKFATAEMLPLVSEFNQANTDAIFSSGIDRHLLLVGKKGDIDKSGKAYSELKAAAEKLRSSHEFVCVTVDAGDAEGEPVVEYFGLEKAKLPVLMGFQVEPEQRKYKCAPAAASLATLPLLPAPCAPLVTAICGRAGTSRARKSHS
jgi:Thioredoxin-like domain